MLSGAFGKLSFTNLGSFSKAIAFALRDFGENKIVLHPYLLGKDLAKALLEGSQPHIRCLLSDSDLFHIMVSGKSSFWSRLEIPGTHCILDIKLVLLIICLPCLSFGLLGSRMSLALHLL